MKFPKGKYTADQQAWCRKYESETGFDPMTDDFEAGNVSFYSAAQNAIHWYESHTSSVHLRIQDGVPGEKEALWAGLGTDAETISSD